jgi:hypothetical protein
VTELSNLLRQRLAGGPQAGVRPDSHPDADTLTAYVERLLPAAERNQVLNHLAVCAHCREVAALAIPAQADDQQVAAAAVPAARRWGFLWNPWFRFAAALPIVVIVAMVLLRSSRQPEDRFKVERSKPEGFVGTSGSGAEKDKNSAQPAPEARRPEAPAQPPGSAGAVRAFSSVNDALGHSQPLSAMAATSRPGPPPAMTIDGAAAADTGLLAETAKAASPVRRDYVNSGFFANNMSTDGAGVNGTVGELPSAPSPRTSNQFPSTSITMNAANTMNFAGMPTQATGTETVRTVAPASGSRRWVATVGAIAPAVKKALSARTTPAIPLESLGYSAMGGKGQLNPTRTQPSEAAAAAPLLDSAASGLEQTGALRRGALSDTSIAGYAAKAEMRESVSNPWRISGGRLVKPGEAGSWVEACPGSATVEVTTFTARGTELWAGGANAALLHSRDGGATCERITLGGSAIGAIVRIEALGAVVLVKSSSGQSWSSQDGGKTWKMDE